MYLVGLSLKYTAEEMWKRAWPDETDGLVHLEADHDPAFQGSPVVHQGADTSHDLTGDHSCELDQEAKYPFMEFSYELIFLFFYVHTKAVAEKGVDFKLLPQR